MGANTNCISGKPHMGLGKFQNFRKRTFLELKTHTLGNFRIQSGTVFNPAIPIHALTYLYIVACRCRSIQVETSVFWDRTSIRPIFTIFTLFRRLGRIFPRFSRIFFFTGIIIFNTSLIGPDFMTSISKLKCTKTALIHCPNSYLGILS